MSMVSHRVPIELYGRIFLFVDDQRDLCALCNVSRTIRHQAEQVQYHTVYLKSESSTLLWSRTIAETPQLAKLVHSLTLGAAVHLDKCDILVAALRAVIHLKTFIILNLSREWSATSHFNPASLSGCNFRLTSYHNQLNIPWDEYSKFLSEQPDIRDWTAPIFNDIDENKSAKVLPHLTVATIYNSEALNVISSRTLQCVTLTLQPLVAIWNNTEVYLGGLVEGICSFGGSLTHLNMNACNPLPCPWASETFINQIAGRLPSLKFLRYAANRVSHYFTNSKSLQVH
jgi:hypothetical protein